MSRMREQAPPAVRPAQAAAASVEEADPGSAPVFEEESRAPVVEHEALELDLRDPHGSQAVRSQVLVGSASAVGSLALAVLWLLLPASVLPGAFFEASPGEMVPMLPLMAVFAVWALFAAGAVVPAFRIGRLARWAEADEDTVPIAPWVARVVSWGMLVVTAVGAAVFGWGLLG